MSVRSETDTVVKRILPYLARRGYDTEKDIDYETPARRSHSYTKGYVDILVTCGRTSPPFLIEAKKASKTLNEKDKAQAIEYGQSLKVPFVVLTNGRNIQCYNVARKEPIKWDGRQSEKIPTKSQLTTVLRALRTNQQITDIPLGTDRSLPFRPGLPLKQLNALFARCHNTIRKIEKNEEHAFDDFSKLLFLKLLEEKADASGLNLPYSYLFYELAERPASEADQVQHAIASMIDSIKRKTSYGDVLQGEIHLKNARTFKYIVEQLASVSFHDSSLDSKGAAFEYFVRATLKGKKLGQYFTPRPLVNLMTVLIGRDKIYNSLKTSVSTKVLDPACGTGGFLVFLMQDNVARAEEDYKKGNLTKKAFEHITSLIKMNTFFGSDANEGVACAAKMNMIITGDGHSNIRAEDSLASIAEAWSVEKPDCDIVITNPPFGTSENDSLGGDDWDQFDLRLKKGQQLFLQKIVKCTVPLGDICTVIDDGLLNTASSENLRQWIFRKTSVRAVIRLPEETFKPNKINVRSSVLLLKRYDEDDIDLESSHDVTFVDLQTLGYRGSGDAIRGFDLGRFLAEFESHAFSIGNGSPRAGSGWRAFDVSLENIVKDGTFRLDLKYWEPETLRIIDDLAGKGAVPIKSINSINTMRGTSPSSDSYVDEKDGYALVVKAGTNITRYGELLEEGDFIEKDVFDRLERWHLKKGDVLIASTGTGTLGKACVFDSDKPAIADGHVTIIRVDHNVVYPYYLADYLRIGLGSLQVERLYTGSTGLIELTPEDVDRVLVDLLGGIEDQEKVSAGLREAERSYRLAIRKAEEALSEARGGFGRPVYLSQDESEIQEEGAPAE